MKINVKKIKDIVAERNGFQSNVLGSPWNYAMLLTNRKKQQLELYEEVIQEILKKSEDKRR